MIINDFVSAMQKKDFKALAACFDDDCLFFDYCPSLVRRQNAFLYGRNAVEMFFHNRFVFATFTMLDPRVIDDRTVDFYIDYQGAMIHAIAQSEHTTDSDSLIKKLVIRPA